MKGLTRREFSWASGAALTLAPFAARAQSAAGIDISGHSVQGGLVIAHVPAGSQAWVAEVPVRVSDGVFCFGFGRDDVNPVTVRAQMPAGVMLKTDVTPTPRTFDIQRINGLPEKYVSPGKVILDEIAADAKAVRDARAGDMDETWFLDAPDWPVQGPLTGFYGSQRILNGEPRAAHYGVDIAAPIGTPVKAPANGVVRLAQPLYLSGHTMVLDHGHGVSTSYLHMSRLDAKVGDKLSRGDVFGAVGMEGRATGPHMCWRLNWFQTRLDVLLVAAPRSTKA